MAKTTQAQKVIAALIKKFKSIYSTYRSYWSHLKKQILSHHLHSLEKHRSYCLYILLFLLLVSSFWPRSRFQEAAWKVGEWPQNPQSHLDLAQESAQNYQFSLAQKELSLANQLNSQFVAQSFCVVQNILHHQIESNNLEREIQQLEEVIQKCPDFVGAYLRLSLLYWQLNNSLQADLYLQKANLLSPNHPGLTQLQQLFTKN